MILVDSSGAYALLDRRDNYHRDTAEFFHQRIGTETFGICLPVIGEVWYLLQTKVHDKAGDGILKAVVGGAFRLVDVDAHDIAVSRQIDVDYEPAAFGFVDATCLALCERHRIDTVMTWNRRNFSIYRPTFCSHLTLVP